MAKKNNGGYKLKDFKVSVKAQYAFTYHQLVDIKAYSKPDADARIRKMFKNGQIPMTKPNKGELVYFVVIVAVDHSKNTKDLENNADNNSEEGGNT